MTTSPINTAAGASQASPSAAVYAKVEKLMSSQSAGVVKLNTALTRDQTKLSGLGQLQSALSDFRALATRLGGAGLSTAASASTKGVLSAIATDKAVAGSYAVDVAQLAQGQSLASAAQKAADKAIGTGAPAAIKVEFGTTASDGRFTAAAGGAKSITIDSSNNTLDGIAAAFRNAGIDAKVVKGSDGYSLSLTGPDGAASSMRIGVTGDAAIKDLVSYNPAGEKRLSQTGAAQDALLTVDGKQVASASNTVNGAITGATLTLTGKGATNVVVAKEAGQITSNVGKLVDAYNSLNAKLQTLQQGVLKGDAALGQVSRQLGQTMGEASRALAAAGVTLDKNGKMQLDEAKLKSAVAANPDAVGKLFTNDGKGLADQLSAKIAALGGAGGSLDRETKAVGKDITDLTGKKAALAKALTAQATALVNMYSQQEQDGKTGTAFDFFA